MRLGGWWRLWIGLTVIWVFAVCALVLFAVKRPTPESEAKSVARSCDLDMPVTPALAPKVLEIPGLLAQLNGPDGDANAEARKPIVQRIKANVEELFAYGGKTTEHSINIVASPEGNKSLVLAPTNFTDEQVFEQARKDKYSLNSWTKFDDYCTGQLQAQSRNELYPKHLKNWIVGTLAGLLSLPFVLLVLGLFIEWIWRGFRPSKGNKPNGAE